MILIVAALLALIIIAAMSLVGWVNGQLTHDDMLTGTPDTPASTWLILGSDERDGTIGTGSAADTPGSRTDSILLLTKPRSGTRSLISFPRDSYVSIDGQDMKLNAVASLKGYQALVKQIETMTDIRIDHVIRVGFGGVEKIVDAVGGVELCYDQDVNDEKSGMQWQAGCHVVDGPAALAFSRMRYSDPKGDIGRTERQRQVIGAVAKKAMSSEVLSDPGKIKTVMEAGLSSVVVDEDTDTFSLIDMVLAFREATGSKGVTGSPYYTDIDYRPASGIGSCILLDDERNADLFAKLADGSMKAGTVGGM